MLDSVVTPLLLSAVVSFDAFSVCIGIGLQPLRLRKIAATGLLIGFFHMLMPLFGLFIGSLLSERISQFSELISGLLLFGIGSQLILQTFAEKVRATPPKILTLPSMVLLAFSVSLDSFPVGISLGISGFQVVFTVLLFGGVSTLTAWSGLLIGKKVQNNLDHSLAWLGGTILCLLGLTIIF